MTSVMISKLELKSEGFNPKVGSTHNFSRLNPSIEDSGLIDFDETASSFRPEL